MDERIIRKVIDDTDIFNIDYEFVTIEIIDGGNRKMISGEEFAKMSRNSQMNKGFRGRMFLDEPRVARTILKTARSLQAEMLKAYDEYHFDD